MKIFTNQKGFAAIETLLIVIILAIIGGVGYFVYQSQSKTNDTLDAANLAAQSTAPPKKKAVTATSPNKETELQAYLLKTCSAKQADAINAMFKNQAVQNVDTDNVKIQDNYAVANINCTLGNNVELTSLFLKYSASKWDLVVKQSTEVNCTFLTNAGFPDQLKAPYCQNQ